MAGALSARERLLNRAVKTLSHRSAPRLHMSLIVFVTALSGLVASFLMLKVGIKWMWIRYPLSVLIAYATFLFLIWLWLYFYRNKFDEAHEIIDLPDISNVSSVDLPTFQGFGGGESGGGGASGSFASDASAAKTSSSSSGGGIIEDLDFSFDLDELILIFVVLGVALSAIVVAVLAVVSAPTLLGEVLIDSALAAGLYRHLKKIERRNWLESAIRRTWISALVLFLVFAVAGLVFHWYAPAADSIGDIWLDFKSNI